jgi:hypothetical protein
MKKMILLLLIPFVGWNCKPSGKTDETDDQDSTVNVVTEKYPKMEPVNFDADSAYGFVARQVAFGPRVPGSGPHMQCAGWLKGELERFTDEVMVQSATVSDNKGGQIALQNIIGIINPSAKDRILLCAHWDTRPQSDEDPLVKNRPADGANDGGSGVGILLEIARQLSINKPGLGVDIVLFDAEDGGDRRGSSETWCIGSQYWSRNPHIPSYRARFGILLDMVGAANARFAQEGHSLNFANNYVQMIWQTGQSLGYGSYFVYEKGGMITDDHYYINNILGIPTTDIIQFSKETQSGFGDYWHTQKDNMSIIDRKTLKAVGHTVIEVIARQNNSGS